MFLARRWDGWKTSVRDTVSQQGNWIKKGQVFHSTYDIIKAIEENSLPDQVMFTFPSTTLAWQFNFLV